MVEEFKIDFYKEALAIKDELIQWRRDFHENPELGFEEYRTSKVIKEFLTKEGIEFYSVANTGICALIKGGYGEKKEVKTIALRADIDALPLQDNKSCSYASKIQGKMHACGHDAHMTILLGAAKILNNNRKHLKGNVKLFFEPAEETVGGARYMIKEGVLENPKVDGVIGLHVSEAIEVGKIGVKQGVFNAASNPFTIKIKGKGGHGAHPEDTIDPIFISSQVILALQSIVSREIPPQSPAVVTIGSIHGGTAQNIIPEEVELKGIIRTMKNEHREHAVKRVKEITEGICKTFRASCDIEVEESYPCLYINDDMLALLKTSAKSILGTENIMELEYPSMGVESFAYFSNERPSVFYFLGTANFQRGINKPAHGSLFDVDEEALPIGVAIQCEAAFNYLTI